MAVSLGGFGSRGLDSYQELLDDAQAERLAEAYAGMRGEPEAFGPNSPAPGYVQRVLNGREAAGTEEDLIEYVVDEVIEEAMAGDAPAWAEQLVSFEVPGLQGTYRSIGRGGYKHGHVDAEEDTVVLTFRDEDTLRGELEQAETARRNMDVAAAHGVPVATRYQTVLIRGETGPKAGLVGDYRGDLVDADTYVERRAREEGCSEEVVRKAVHSRVHEDIVEPLLDLYKQGTVAYRSPGEIRMMDLLKGNVGFDLETDEPYLMDAGELGDRTFAEETMPHNSREAFLTENGLQHRVESVLSGVADAATGPRV